MSEEDAKRILEGLQSYVAETTSSPEKALAALVAAGLVDENGQPTAPYKD